MSESDLYLLRIVIQQIGISDHPTYRLVVYGDCLSPRHSDFGNAQVLLEALHVTLPDFDVSKLSLNPLGDGQGSMVFVGEMKLSKTQLSLLGLS